MVDGIVHYGVTNMPGAVAGTSTYALTNVTLPYALELANQGWRDARLGVEGTAGEPAIVGIQRSQGRGGVAGGSELVEDAGQRCGLRRGTRHPA